MFIDRHLARFGSHRTSPLTRAARLAAGAAALGGVLFLWPGFGTAQDVRRTSAPPDGLREQVPQTYALVGADIVVRPGEVIEGGTLVVRKGKITDVGREVEVPADAEEIDVSGKRIYAGFIDAYAELPAEQSGRDPALADGQAANYWNRNVTPQISAARILSIDARAHETLRKVGVVARLYAPSAGVIRGRAALVSTAEGVQGDRAVLAEDVGMLAQLRPLGRGFGGGYPNSPMGAFALVRQALYDADWYAQARQAVAEDPSLPLPERNDALAALRPVLEGEMPMFFKNLDERYAVRSARVAEEFGLDAVHIGSGYEYRRASEVAETGVPIILPLSLPRPPDVSTPEQADAVTLESLMHWDLAPDNPRLMQEAGTTIAFSTEGMRRIDQEFMPNLRRVVARGLRADAALAALTSDAAEILGVADRLGTLENGKIASFIITDGDLFAQRSRARVLETWVEGRRHVVVRDPVVDFRGTWELTLPDGEKVQFQVGGTPERLTGRITAQPATRPGTRPAEPEAPDEQPEQEQSEDPDSESDDPDSGDAAEHELTAGQAQPQQERPARGQRRRPGEASEEDRPEAEPDRAAQAPRPTGPGALRNIRQSAGRLSFTTDARPFGQRGVAVVSLVRVGESVTGTALLPDGTRIPVEARMTRGPETRPATRPAREPTEAAPPGVEEPDVHAGEGMPTEPQGGTTRTAPPERDPPDEGIELDEVPTTRPAAVAAAEERNRPLFQPNYPLGAYGRDSSEPPEQQTVVFTNATIWTSGPQGRIENGYLIVSGGEILAVGEGSPRDIPEDATEIDLEGRHIAPGIIDCHSHIASDSGINEGSQAITCEVRLRDYVNPDDINIYRQLAGGTTIANTLHGSANPIGGQNVVIKFRWGQSADEFIMPEAPEGVKFALGENVKRSGAGGSGRYPGSRMGVPELIADAFRAAQDYRRARENFEANGGLPVRRDLELDALVEMLDGDRLIHCHSYRQDEILATLRVLEEFDIQIGSLQHILEGYKVAREMAEHGKDLPDSDGLGATASSFSDWWAYKFEVYDAIPHNGAIMHRAGVNVSFNSDDAELARRLNTEAAKAIKYGGIPEEEALKFVTINPAMQLRIDRYVGSLEPGKHADFAIWTRSPLSTMSRVEQTWIDGRKYFDREEDLEKRRKVQEMRAALIQRVLSSGEQPAAAGETPVRESDLWPSEDIYCGHGNHIDTLHHDLLHSHE